MKTVNAVIKSTKVEIEDHGHLTAFLFLDYGGSCQGFGGYGLYSPYVKMKEKNYAGHFLYRTLEAVGVREWDSLTGKAIRVAIGDDGLIKGIGHIIKDDWFYPTKEFEEIDGDKK
jgi:hypothetical protein